MLSDDPIPSQTYVKLIVLSRPPMTSALPERGDRSASCGRASEALTPCPTHSAQLRAQTVFFWGVFDYRTIPILGLSMVRLSSSRSKNSGRICTPSSLQNLLLPPAMNVLAPTSTVSFAPTTTNFAVLPLSDKSAPQALSLPAYQPYSTMSLACRRLSRSYAPHFSFSQKILSLYCDDRSTTASPSTFGSAHPLY